MQSVVLLRLPSYYNVAPPLGIGYLLKSLKSIAGIKPVFIDMHRDRIKKSVLFDRLRSIDPILVGVQIFSVDYDYFRQIIPGIRKACPNTTIVAGGPHISGLPRKTMLDNPQLDYAVVGEGEKAIKQITVGLMENRLQQKQSRIDNLVFRSNQFIVINKSQYVDVNEYDATAWNLLEFTKYPPTAHGTFHKGKIVAPILTSRGCPFPCTFCAGHLITGKKIRRRDPVKVVDEIEMLIKTYGVDEVIIEDENFTFYKEHVIAIAGEVARRNIHVHFSLPNGIRLDRIDEQIVYHLKQMGVYMTTLGIESASRTTLKAMRKNWDLDMVCQRIDLLRKNKIIVNGAFILGYSNETMRDIKKTIDFALKSELDTAYFGNYIPLPGTFDFNRMVETGELKLDQIDWKTYTSGYGTVPYHPKGVAQDVLLNAIKKATIRFYVRPKILFGLLRRVSRPRHLKNLIKRVIMLYKPSKVS